MRIESWVDLEKFNEDRRQTHLSDNEGDEDEEEDEDDEEEGEDDDDSKTLRLNSEESGNEQDDKEISLKHKKKINFELNNAMGTDIKSKRSFIDGYDLNTSLTTILSRERQHTNDER